tara:strand:+ start:522 stop:1157 length:636 start_codon:yes stop_codon:yes gene_type:complete
MNANLPANIYIKQKDNGEMSLEDTLIHINSITARHLPDLIKAKANKNDAKRDATQCKLANQLYPWMIAIFKMRSEDDKKSSIMAIKAAAGSDYAIHQFTSSLAKILKTLSEFKSADYSLLAELNKKKYKDLKKCVSEFPIRREKGGHAYGAPIPSSMQEINERREFLSFCEARIKAEERKASIKNDIIKKISIKDKEINNLHLKLAEVSAS